MAEHPYHHGNLREALIEAGLGLLEEGGSEALSLRACAARAGVSHAAPAHHFGDLRALLTALAVNGFAQLTGAVAGARQKAGAEAAAALHGFGEAYVDFAREKPALFALMFDAPRLDPDDEALAEAVAGLRDELASVAEPASRRTGPAGPHTPDAMEDFFWTMIHGQAQLALAAHAGRNRAGAMPETGPMLRTVTGLMLEA